MQAYQQLVEFFDDTRIMEYDNIMNVIQYIENKKSFEEVYNGLSLINNRYSANRSKNHGIKVHSMSNTIKVVTWYGMEELGFHQSDKIAQSEAQLKMMFDIKEVLQCRAQEIYVKLK